MTPTGRVLLQVREHALRGPNVVEFLQHLLRHIAGQLLLVIWDGSPIHRAQVVKDFLAQAEAAGATITDRAHDRPWGIYSGYFRDPDGHLWEILFNPHLNLNPS